MKMPVLVGVAIAIVLGAMLATRLLYVVDEAEQVVITEFGKTIDVHTEAGLRFKLPWQTVHFFEKRLLQWDGPERTVTTGDKKFIEVDATARWRIIDARKYLESVQGDERSAQRKIGEIINSTIKDVLNANPLIEIVRSDRSDRLVEKIRQESARLQAEGLSDQVENRRATGGDDLQRRIKKGREQIQLTITRESRKALLALGIELQDLRIRRMNYVEDVRRSIYERMRSERRKIAERYRAQGEGEAFRIRGEKSRRLRIIESTANRRVEELMGEGDAKAAEIYATAYQVDPEFYSFYRTLKSYEQALRGRIRPLFSVEGEYFKYLKDRGGDPLPPSVQMRRKTELGQIRARLDGLRTKYGGDEPANGEPANGEPANGAPSEPELVPELKPEPTPEPVPAPAIAPAPTPEAPALR